MKAVFPLPAEGCKNQILFTIVPQSCHSVTLMRKNRPFQLFHAAKNAPKQGVFPFMKNLLSLAIPNIFERLQHAVQLGAGVPS